MNTIPTNIAVKHDGGKPPLSYISRDLIEGIAQVREFGARKYAPHNWKNGFNYTRSIDAALRHIFAFLDGEDMDPESKMNHLLHAVCSLEHVYYAQKNLDKKFDDRYKKP